MTKTINNTEINYLDVVHHTTTTRFSLWDRIKILFGEKVIVESKLYTAEECNIVATEIKTRVAPMNTMITIGTKGEGHSFMVEPEKPSIDEKPV